MKELSQSELQVFSTLVSRALLSAKLGSQFSGDRNLYEALGYKTTLTYDDYLVQYTRQDIAQAIVVRPVEKTWTGNLQVMENEKGEKTPFEKEWSKLSKGMSLSNIFERLDKLTCLGRYGVLLFGFNDIKKREDWKTPVKPGAKLLYLKPLGESAAQIHSFVRSNSDKRFGLPALYDVALVEPSIGSAVSSSISWNIQVHHSRVIHVIYEQLESDVEGEPLLKSVFNRLMDLEKLTGGSAEMFWKGARPGYSGTVEKDYQLTPDMEADLKDQIDEYEHGLRRILVNDGLNLQALAMQIADPSSHVDIQIQMISAKTGIPKRILTGSERGELSSNQDEDSWLSYIKGRQEKYAEPKIVRPFINKCIELGILPAPTGEWNVSWGDLFAKSEKDQAEVGRIRATALREYTLNPFATEVIPPQSFFEFFLGLSQEQINLIMQMRENGDKIDMSAIESPEEMAIRKDKEKETRSQVKPIQRTK